MTGRVGTWDLGLFVLSEKNWSRAESVVFSVPGTVTAIKPDDPGYANGCAWLLKTPVAEVLKV